MGLRFLGIYPNTPDNGSPTIWLDEGSGDLLIQSYKATMADVKGCQPIGSVPGRTTDMLDHETIIRLPANMLQFIPRTAPETEVVTAGDGSPTIWLDESSGDLLIRSYRASETHVKGCQEVGSVPGHTTDVPDHETIIRLPANMLQFIPRTAPETNDDPKDDNGVS